MITALITEQCGLAIALQTHIWDAVVLCSNLVKSADSQE